MKLKREVSSDEEEVRRQILSYGDYAGRFLKYFDSLDFDFIEIVKNPHPIELFPALRGVIYLNGSDVSENPHAFYSYELGLHPQGNSIWMNFFRRRNHHKAKFSARFDKEGLKLVSGCHPFSKDNFLQYAPFCQRVADIYGKVYS